MNPETPVQFLTPPDHLYLGDRIKNAQDMSQRGRVQRGAKHFRSKLTDIDVIIIREASIIGFSNASIGRYFRVGANTISNIKHEKTWKHI